jgi:glycosyltransferase involved in cell wall biosynthesis
VHSTFVPPPFVPKNMAYTLPCTSVWQCPEFFPALIRLRLQALCGIGVRRSKMVLCISHHVREFLMDRFNVPEERLPYVPLGASQSFRPMSLEERKPIVEEKYGLKSPYFLFSGRWEARKNVLRLLVAFSQFKQTDKNDVKLAFTGARTWASKEADELIRQLAIEPHVVDLGKTPMDELPALYSGALAITYPSLWESFGLVIVEAMRCGVPVLTSNVSAMPEIAGDAGVLVNPRNVQQMAEAMAQLSQDADLRKHLGEVGIERASEFSWDRTARLSLEAYKRIAMLN